MDIYYLKDLLSDIDHKISYYLFKCWPRGSKNKTILRLLEWSGHGLIWFTFAIALVYLYPQNPFFGALLVGLILDIILVAVIKAFVRRRRPHYAPQADQFLVISVDKHSLPSGHASRAFYIAHLFKGGFFLSTLVWLWAISVGASRIFLGRHHVFDVIVGMLLASFTISLQFAFNGLINNSILWILSTSFGFQFSNTNDFSEMNGFQTVFDDDS